MELITTDEALAAVPKRKIIHCFASFLGADWDRRSVIKEIKMAQRIAWIDDIFRHELAIEAGPESTWHGRSILRFDVQKPGEKE